METFSVTYALHVPTYEEAKQVAWSIQVEQTIEFPYELLGESDPRRQMVGQLLTGHSRIMPDPNSSYDSSRD